MKLQEWSLIMAACVGLMLILGFAAHVAGQEMAQFLDQFIMAGIFAGGILYRFFM